MTPMRLLFKATVFFNSFMAEVSIISPRISACFATANKMPR